MTVVATIGAWLTVVSLLSLIVELIVGAVKGGSR